MLEFDEGTNSSTMKYNTLVKSAKKHNEDINRCAEIIYQLETEETLSLNDRDLLKSELGDLVDEVKSNSVNIDDALVTEYQLHNATAPRSTQNLSGLQLLKEKVVDKDRNRRLTAEEQQSDESFYYHSDED